MKRIADTEVSGFKALLGENVMVFCANYIYTGKLSGVNETCIALSDPRIVYETGPFSEKKFKDAQSLNTPNNEWYIQMSAIESFGPTKKS